MKRVFDLLISIILIIPATFIIIVSAVFVTIETRGNPIFRQLRVGRDERWFVLYKIRTMDVSTGNRASHEVSDASITKTGRILRETKIDELPQIWSVLKGDMSFVGPRPCLPQQTRLIALRRDLGALTVRPGITGPAQINGIDMSTPEKLATIDAEYARDHNFFSDIKIMLLTVAGGGSGDAVTRI